MRKDHRSRLRERLVSTCVVGMPVRIQQVARRALGDLVDLGKVRAGRVGVLIVDHEHAVWPRRYGDISAHTEYHLDPAAHVCDFRRWRIVLGKRERRRHD